MHTRYLNPCSLARPLYACTSWCKPCTFPVSRRRMLRPFLLVRASWRGNFAHPGNAFVWCEWTKPRPIFDVSHSSVSIKVPPTIFNRKQACCVQFLYRTGKIPNSTSSQASGQDPQNGVQQRDEGWARPRGRFCSRSRYNPRFVLPISIV